jgi:transcriptional regulator of heat shock response
MSGLEVAAAVFGVVAGTIDLIHKSIEIYDAVKDKSKIPKALRKVSDKLPSIEELLRGAQAQYKEGKLNKIDKQTWDNAKHEIVKCKELCQELHDLVLSAYPEADSGKAERLWKGTKTVFSGKGKSAEVLLKEIWEYLALLAERQIINNTALLEDIKSLVDGLTGRESTTQQHSGSGHNIGGDNYEQHGDGEMFTGNMGSVTFNKGMKKE